MTADHYEVGQDVAWVEAEELGLGHTAVYVARVPAGPPLLLSDAAWAIWLAVAESGTLTEIVVRTAELTESEPPAIATSVATFLGELVALGLVDRLPPS